MYHVFTVYVKTNAPNSYRETSVYHVFTVHIKTNAQNPYRGTPSLLYVHCQIIGEEGERVSVGCRLETPAPLPQSDRVVVT